MCSTFSTGGVDGGVGSSDGAVGVALSVEEVFSSKFCRSENKPNGCKSVPPFKKNEKITRFGKKSRKKEMGKGYF